MTMLLVVERSGRREKLKYVHGKCKSTDAFDAKVVQVLYCDVLCHTRSFDVYDDLQNASDEQFENAVAKFKQLLYCEYMDI